MKNTSEELLKEFSDWYDDWWEKHANDSPRPTTYESMLAAWIAGGKLGVELMADRAKNMFHPHDKSD